MQTLGKTKDDFEFFLSFAHEVMDGYGRLLAYINRAQPNAEQPAPRPLSYNERLLEQGMVTPLLHLAQVAFPEDRLFVPSEYVPLFEHEGWRRGR
jgi:hypothetical protein